MIRFSAVLFFLLIRFGAFGQTLEISSSTLAGTNDKLPFWLWANQLGRYDQASDFIQNFRLEGKFDKALGNSAFSFQSGASLDLLLSSQNEFRFTELYGGISWKILQLTAGAFADPALYDGLSSTNGNLAASLNARPHPKIRAGFSRFVKIFPGFSINGFYEEGLLNDNRYVKDTHLHRKSLYLRFGNAKSIQVTGGMEHFVMWWGTHPEYGKLQGWEAYFNYVLGKSGNGDALATDQANVSGNSFGSYQLEIRKDWNHVSAAFYLSHPFDDRSGMEWDNYRDNLIGFYITNARTEALIHSFVVEYFSTKHQSGSYHLVSQPDGTLRGRGLDNYFNHGVYRSGVTYHEMAMVNPLIGPVRRNENVALGFESTRFSGFHIGILGNLTQNLSWKGKLTYSKHLGQYKGENENTYDPPRKQGAALLELNWHPEKLPFVLGASAAIDHGSLYDAGTSTTRLGTMLKVSWQIAK